MVADEAGLVLSGRTLGALLREQIEELAKQHSEVIVDFAGIEVVTPGFADELFAKMTPSLVDTGRIRFAHLHGDVSVLRDLVVIQRMRA
jgi:hypothetical protein